ncbi:MAG: hypothetical protein ABEJ65_05120 [bacterium]
MTVSMDDVQAMDMKIGTVKNVRDHPDADNLLLLDVDLGEADNRQLVAGIKNDYNPNEIVDQQIVVIANMETATIRGEESKGMLLAADGDVISLLQPDRKVAPGTDVH